MRQALKVVGLVAVACALCGCERLSAWWDLHGPAKRLTLDVYTRDYPDLVGPPIEQMSSPYWWSGHQQIRVDSRHLPAGVSSGTGGSWEVVRILAEDSVRIRTSSMIIGTIDSLGVMSAEIDSADVGREPVRLLTCCGTASTMYCIRVAPKPRFRKQGHVGRVSGRLLDATTGKPLASLFGQTRKWGIFSGRHGALRPVPSPIMPFGGFVGVAWTDIESRADSTGFFELDSLPGNSVTLVGASPYFQWKAVKVPVPADSVVIMLDRQNPPRGSYEKRR